MSEAPHLRGADQAADAMSAVGRLARAHAWVVTGPLRFAIPVAWVAVAVAATMYLPGIASSPAALNDLTPKNAQALRVEAQAAHLFALPILSRTVVVQRAARGLSLKAQRQTVAAALAIDRHKAAAPPGVLGAVPLLDTGRRWRSR